MIHNKLTPWRIATARRIAVTHATLGLVWWEAYWKCWAAVMYPDGK